MTERPPASPNQEPVAASPAPTGPAGLCWRGRSALTIWCPCLPEESHGACRRIVTGSNSSVLPSGRLTMSSFRPLTVMASRQSSKFKSNGPSISRQATLIPGACRANRQGRRQTGIRHASLRAAVDIQRTSTEIERSYQEVLSWARELGTPETFFSRLRQKRLANSDMRKFVENFRANLKQAGALHDDPAVWRSSGVSKSSSLISIRKDLPRKFWCGIAAGCCWSRRRHRRRTLFGRPSSP